MKVLFWVDKFPTYSETFIRDQIISLIDNGIEVFIFSNHLKFDEIDSLKFFKSYNLTDKILSYSSILPKDKKNKIYNIFKILFRSIFTYNSLVYIKLFAKYFNTNRRFLLENIFLLDFIIKNKINIIHAHFGPNGPRASLLKELGLKIKLFTTFHGYDIRLGQSRGLNFYKKLFDNSTGIISISNYNFENLLKFGAHSTKIFNIPNGINTEFFKRNEQISSGNKIKIVTVARLVPEKGLHIAIEAVKKLINKQPDLEIEYNIIGDGELKNSLEKLVIDYELVNIVKLLGRKNSNEVRDFLIHSDIFILSSISEALPTVIVEAQSCELPILATNVGSIKDMVKGGIVVKSNDLEAFEAGLLELIKLRENWRIIGKQGRDFVIKNFDIQDQTKKIIDMYNI